MATLPLTRSKHLISFAGLLRKAGEPVRRLLLKARLPANCLDDGDMIISSDAAFRFRQLASEELDLRNIAIDATQRLGIADLGEFGSALLRAPTLHRLLTEFRNLTNTQTTMAEIEVETRKGGDVSICHRFDHIPECGVWHSDLYILQWMTKLIQLVDPAWTPTEVWSQTPPALGYKDALERLGAKSVVFGRQYTGFMVPSSMLALPLAGPDREATADQVDENHVREAVLPQSCSDALRRVIETYARDRWLSIGEAAEVFDQSARTIQRRLAHERTTYNRVLEQARAELAGGLLETTDATIADIARQLGYRGQGNFARAFRRWAGVSPSEFRRQRLRK
jgi:AraC-like DNA-binding protein